MNWKKTIQLITSVLLPIIIIGSIVFERLGGWDYFLGLNEVEKVASRFETSYAEGVDRQVGPDEPAWKPIMKLVRRYSPAIFPQNREPKCLARYVAISSSKINLDNGEMAEWTAPSTPMIITFIEPPRPMTNADVLIVGSIGDIRRWIDMRRADIKFLINDIILGLTAVLLAFFLWFEEYKSK